MMDDDAGHGKRASSPRGGAAAPDNDGRLLPLDDDRPTVEHRAWLRQDDYWKRTTYIAATGRHTATAPRTRALPRPDRFRQPRPIRSGIILLLIVGVIVLVPAGVGRAQRWAEQHINLPSTIPGISAPAPTHTATPAKHGTPTATPKKK